MEKKITSDADAHVKCIFMDSFSDKPSFEPASYTHTNTHTTSPKSKATPPLPLLIWSEQAQSLSHSQLVVDTLSLQGLAA